MQIEISAERRAQKGVGPHDPDNELPMLSARVVDFNRMAASVLKNDLDRRSSVPMELGELYEDLANVFLDLADAVRRKQRQARAT